MAVSLIINTSITNLNLRFNAIGPKGTSYITIRFFERMREANLLNLRKET